MIDYRQWLKMAIGRLAHSGSAKRDAEILLAHVTGSTRAFILAFDETLLTVNELSCLEKLLIRRERGEPIAYLVGEREFWSLPLSVSPATLIPRPDTECLVELALKCLPEDSCSILDLGTGSGAIALALASERPDCLVTGVDIQPDAVLLAQYNADKLAIANCCFLQGSWFLPVRGQKFAVIVSNPPYIDENDPHLAQGDVRFEPKSALTAKAGGLADLAQIIQQAIHHLYAKGWLLLEHGWQQGEAVRLLLQEAGFSAVATHVDYGGNERVTLGQLA